LSLPQSRNLELPPLLNPLLPPQSRLLELPPLLNPLLLLLNHNLELEPLIPKLMDPPLLKKSMPPPISPLELPALSAETDKRKLVKLVTVVPTPRPHAAQLNAPLSMLETLAPPQNLVLARPKADAETGDLSSNVSQEPTNLTELNVDASKETFESRSFAPTEFARSNGRIPLVLKKLIYE